MINVEDLDAEELNMNKTIKAGKRPESHFHAVNDANISVSSIYEMTCLTTTEDEPHLSYSQTPAFTQSQPKVRKFAETSALVSMPLVIDIEENN